MKPEPEPEQPAWLRWRVTLARLRAWLTWPVEARRLKRAGYTRIGWGHWAKDYRAERAAAFRDAESDSWDGPGVDAGTMIAAADERRRAAQAEGGQPP